MFSVSGDAHIFTDQHDPILHYRRVLRTNMLLMNVFLSGLEAELCM